jgi:hypothetical protein
VVYFSITEMDQFYLFIGIRDGGLQRRTLEYEGDRGRGAKPTLFGIGSGAERSEGLRDGDLAGVERPATVASNVKHQRARATASRAKERSRCARSAACASWTPSRGESTGKMRQTQGKGAD